jgi:hypothetical protein
MSGGVNDRVPRSTEVLISQTVGSAAAREHRLVLLARKLFCGVVHVPRSMAA